MSQRIRQLEDALAIAADKYTTPGIHPLLSDDSPTIKFGPESGVLSTDSHEGDSGTDHGLFTPGSLFKYPDGSTTYFGPSGGSGENYVPLRSDPCCSRRNQEAVLLVGPPTPAGLRLLRLHSGQGRIYCRPYGRSRLRGGPQLPFRLGRPQPPRPDVCATGFAPGYR